MASALILGSSLMLAVPGAQSYVLPVIDGAKIAQDAMNWALDAADRATTLANWITQLQNWKQSLSNLIRGEMKKVIGQQLMDQREEQQILQIFQRRQQQCQKLNNSASQKYCGITVQLEKEKYEELKKMDKKVQETFNNSINQLISEQNRAAKSDTGSGEAQSAENSVIAHLEKLNIELKQHQTKIESLDQLIEQYRWIRKNLTKEQLSGQGPQMIGKTAGSLLLQKKAKDYRNKAAELRRNNIGISNRF